MPFSFFGEVAGVFLWTSHGSLMLFLNVCLLFTHSAAPGLSYGAWDPRARHVTSSFGMWDLVLPHQGLNPGSPQWGHEILATGAPGKSPRFCGFTLPRSQNEETDMP